MVGVGIGTTSTDYVRGTNIRVFIVFCLYAPRGGMGIIRYPTDPTSEVAVQESTTFKFCRSRHFIALARFFCPVKWLSLSAGIGRRCQSSQVTLLAIPGTIFQFSGEKKNS
jgi:hypothetical protein